MEIIGTKEQQVWEANASLWIQLAESGFDFFRDKVSTPGFFAVLPDVEGLSGLDIGCGYGHNTRLLADKGAIMTGVDISESFLRCAGSCRGQEQEGIAYVHSNAASLPFEHESFDFATAFNSLCDMEDIYPVLREVYRTLKKGGFFQFVIPHPCFWHYCMDWKTDQRGEKVGLVCSGYFEESPPRVIDWMFEGVPPYLSRGKFFKSVFVKRRLEDWFSGLFKAGFVVEDVHEPRPSANDCIHYQCLRGATIVPYFLVVRSRKFHASP